MGTRDNPDPQGSVLKQREYHWPICGMFSARSEIHQAKRHGETVGSAGLQDLLSILLEIEQAEQRAGQRRKLLTAVIITRSGGKARQWVNLLGEVAAVRFWWRWRSMLRL